MGVDRSAIVERESLEQEIEGLDALDVPFVEPETQADGASGAPPGRSSRRWASCWPPGR